MSQPWHPSPNPGGNNRRLIRYTVAAWITAQRIQGLDHVYPTLPPYWNFDSFDHTGDDFGALVAVTIPSDSEDRLAFTGPTDSGGKLVHYPIRLRFMHASYTIADDDLAAASEDDYDRIYEALKDCFRADGRDLGRPDVILVAGDYPRVGSLVGSHNDPVIANGGSIWREGSLALTVSQYLTEIPPQP